MHLHYLLPSLACQPWLSMHAVVSEVVCPHEVVLPAMLPNLHIRLAAHSAYAVGDGPLQRAPTVALIGPTSRAYRMAFGPGFQMLSVGLLPLGWQAVAGWAADQSTDAVLDGELVWGRAAVVQLLQALEQTCLPQAQCDAVESFLKAQARTVARTQLLQGKLIDHWLEHSPTLSLEELTARLGVGERQVRRLTLAQHGLSPKALAMKYRALRLAATLAQGAAAQTDFQHYADQSHAIRDFQRFVGWTPGHFARDHGVARATLYGRWCAGAQRPLVLLS